MKGFPNQVSDLIKIASGMQALVNLVDAGENAKDDGIFGPELVRAGVAGTGHLPRPIDEYIRDQLTKRPDRQSFRATARGLRELYRMMGLIDDSELEIEITELGRRAAAFAGQPLNDEQLEFWRGVINNITHPGGGDTSHPYQVMLRLVARKPGIRRAKCALALEATNDSPEELARIVALADLAEESIKARIGVTDSNWDNAKKVLPRFAEQLGDVIRSGEQEGTYVIADGPGRAYEGLGRTAPARAREVPTRVVAPRSSREVSPNTIGRAGTREGFDEVPVPGRGVSAEDAAETNRLRASRLRRHNLIVRALAELLNNAHARLYADPFDILALFHLRALLIEVKSLDGTVEDERDRVRDALSQLLYYEAFVMPAVTGDAIVCKVACFEQKISDPHRQWLNRQGIATIWKEDGIFVGDALASDFLGPHVDEFR